MHDYKLFLLPKQLRSHFPRESCGLWSCGAVAVDLYGDTWYPIILVSQPLPNIRLQRVVFVSATRPVGSTRLLYGLLLFWERVFVNLFCRYNTCSPRITLYSFKLCRSIMLFIFFFLSYQSSIYLFQVAMKYFLISIC